MVSNVDDILNDFVTKLQTITTANKFNETPVTVSKIIKDMYEITEFPQISVTVGNSQISPMDTTASVFKETIDMNIVGYVNANTDITNSGTLTIKAESLISDIKQALSQFIKTNINEPSPNYGGIRYFIDIFNTPLKIFRLLDDKQNVGMVGLNFKVISYAQDQTSLSSSRWNIITSNHENLTTTWELY